MSITDYEITYSSKSIQNAVYCRFLIDGYLVFRIHEHKDQCRKTNADHKRAND